MDTFVKQQRPKGNNLTRIWTQ